LIEIVGVVIVNVTVVNMSNIKYGSNVSVYQYCGCKKQLMEHRIVDKYLKCVSCNKKYKVE
jgi:hypothetical protein